MKLLADTRARSLGTTLLLWGAVLLGALFVLSFVVSTLLSLFAAVVAIVKTLAAAVILGGIAYLLASWALGSDEDERPRERANRRGRTGYGLDAPTGRRSGDARSSRESDEGGSILGRVPGIGGDDRDDEPQTDPIDRLTDRYVRGEIGEAEYERRLERHLDGSSIESVDEFETVRNTEYDR